MTWLKDSNTHLNKKQDDTGLSDSNALLCVGQIKKGDTVLCEYKGKKEAHIVEEVLYPGAGNEEILLDVDDNYYFVTSMAIDGTSWAKNVKVLKLPHVEQIVRNKLDRIAKAIHYPDCWDTMAYPTLLSAISEIGCNPEDCSINT